MSKDLQEVSQIISQSFLYQMVPSSQGGHYQFWKTLFREVLFRKDQEAEAQSWCNDQQSWKCLSVPSRDCPFTHQISDCFETGCAGIKISLQYIKWHHSSHQIHYGIQTICRLLSIFTWKNLCHVMNVLPVHFSNGHVWLHYSRLLNDCFENNSTVKQVPSPDAARTDLPSSVYPIPSSADFVSSELWSNINNSIGKNGIG